MKKPRVVGPAMNPMMWEHPVTEKQLDVLRQLEFVVVDPIAKGLACGDVGMGAMAEPETIADIVIGQLLATSG
ncbi:hypothetical protein LPJ57_000430 [Coemansia sp. RSA 486]|nr:hypothetical protein LPJ57_000430 [Coemansia sp. RSA 486]